MLKLYLFAKSVHSGALKLLMTKMCVSCSRKKKIFAFVQPEGCRQVFIVIVANFKMTDCLFLSASPFIIGHHQMTDKYYTYKKKINKLKHFDRTLKVKWCNKC